MKETRKCTGNEAHEGRNCNEGGTLQLSCVRCGIELRCTLSSEETLTQNRSLGNWTRKDNVSPPSWRHAMTACMETESQAARHLCRSSRRMIVCLRLEPLRAIDLLLCNSRLATLLTSQLRINFYTFPVHSSLS